MQKFQIGDSVEIIAVGEVKRIGRDIVTGEINYSVEFGHGNFALVTGGLLSPAPSKEPVTEKGGTV